MPASLIVRDPADGSQVGELESHSPEEVAGCVDRARAAAGAWAQLPAADRGSLLREAADRVEAVADELALLTTREMGKPLADARGGVAAGIATLRQYAELGPLHRGRSLQGSMSSTDLMRHVPRGVVAALTPWNDPVAVPCGLLGAALATGNTVVFKPSERTPHTGRLLGGLLGQGLPPDVLTTLLGAGDIGAALAAAPGVDVVAHVGGTATGRAVLAATLGNDAHVVLENGGNDALVVDADVDPEWAAEQAALGAFANAGQICTSVERVFVHEAVAVPFVDALVRRAKALRMGPGTDPATELGPLVDRAHRNHVHAHVTDAVAAGAHLLAGGELPRGPGAYYPATVLLGCEPSMLVMREETFGPVAPVWVVGSYEEALALAAASSYGLAASVLTASIAHAQRAAEVLPVGTLKVNAVFGGAPGGAAEPRGASGRGFGYGPELLDEFTTTVVMHLSPPVLPEAAPYCGA